MNNELEELEDEIDRIILKNNIRLIYSKLESSDPDMAVISKNNRRAIIINTNYDIKTSVIMRKSHELMHHLFNDYDTSITYTYSEQLKNQHEINANLTR